MQQCTSHLILHKKPIGFFLRFLSLQCSSPHPSFITEIVFPSTFKIYTLVNSKVELDEEESELTAEENSPVNDARKDYLLFQTIYSSCIIKGTSCN